MEYPPPKIYQYSKTKFTYDMMTFMAKRNKIPTVHIHDPFIEKNIDEMSGYKIDFIDELIRTTQIILFDQFQESMRNWTEITKQMRTEFISMKCNRKQQCYLNSRNRIQSRAQTIDIENIRKLPNEIIHLIWGYVDVEVQNKYFLGKYLYPKTPHQNILFKNLLQRFNIKILRTLYKKTAFCYHGLCMQKMIPPERFDNPPISRKTKNDLMIEIIRILNDYLDMYSDPLFSMITKTNGQMVSKLHMFQRGNSEYYGYIYPMDFYETKTLQLWKHLAIAFSLFLAVPLSHYFSEISEIYVEILPITPPLLSLSSDESDLSPNESIGFIFV